MEEAAPTAFMECIFENCLDSCSVGEKTFAMKPLSANQIKTVKDSSLQRKDGFGKHITDSENLDYHTSCYATYTSKNKIEKFLKAKRKQTEPTDGPKRKHLRSG